jgi:enoyl-[acyl-carrier-protein] reductase (NADH)
MFYLKGKKMNEEDMSDLYDRLQDEFDGEQVDEIMHAVAYSFAEMVDDLEIPKREFIARFVEVFDSAYAYITKPEKNNG